MLMLPERYLVLLDVLDILKVLFPTVIVTQNPTDMGKPETSASGVWIEIILIDMAVVAAMIRGPVHNVILQSTGSSECEDQSQEGVSLVSFVGPHAVVSGCNRQAGKKHHAEKD